MIYSYNSHWFSILGYYVEGIDCHQSLKPQVPLKATFLKGAVPVHPVRWRTTPDGGTITAPRVPNKLPCGAAPVSACLWGHCISEVKIASPSSHHLHRALSVPAHPPMNGSSAAGLGAAFPLLPPVPSTHFLPSLNTAVSAPLLCFSLSLSLSGQTSPF